MTPRPAEYVITLRPEPAGRDGFGREPAERLRMVLKRLLRAYGFRCVSVRQVEKSSASLASGDTLVNSEGR